MEKIELDSLDKKILNCLNKDPKAHYTKIAKESRSSKEVVKYRINKLEQNGIINGYVTILGLGYWANKVLVKYDKITNESENKFIKYLEKHPHINWVTPSSGNWDLVFVIMSENPIHFNKIFNDIRGKFGKYIKEYKFSTSIGSSTFGHTYLISAIKESKKVKRNLPAEIKLDEKDKKILNCLINNARVKIIEINKKTNIPTDTIQYRIKNMEKEGIIKRYRLIIDSSKLGYNRHELFLSCLNLSEETAKKFEKFGELNSNVEYIGFAVGAWDVTFTVHFHNNEELKEFIIRLKSELGEYIQNIESVILFQTRNYTYIPNNLI